MSQQPSEDEEDEVDYGGEEEPQVINADDDGKDEYTRKKGRREAQPVLRELGGEARQP